MSETIEAAKAPGVFSLDKFLVDIAYPVETVTVYTNAYAVNEKMKLSKEAIEIDNKINFIRKQDEAEAERAGGQKTITEATKDSVPADLITRQIELAGKVETLSAEIEKSKLTLHLRGMAPHVVEDLTATYFTDPKVDYTGTKEETERDLDLIAKSIYQIEDADGNISDSPMSATDVAKLQGSLLAGEYYKIVSAVAHTNLNGALFEQAADAPFPSGRSNVAG